MDAKASFRAKIKEKLADLLIHSSEFAKLEERFGIYCPFDALSVSKWERSHSKFLADLLNPQRPHGFGSQTLRALLIKAISKAEKIKQPPLGISTIDVQLMNLESAVVVAEWQRIDILIKCEDEKLIVAAEIKIDAQQSENQLAGYRELIERRWPTEQQWRHMFLYITKSDERPDDPKWLRLSFDEVVLAFEPLTSHSGQNDLARMMLRSYISMMRRHHVIDKELRELASTIWEKHSEALEFLVAERRDLLDRVFESLQERSKNQIVEQLNKVGKVGDVWEYDSHTTGASASIRFAYSPWDELSEFKEAAYQGSKSGRFILFEIAREISSGRHVVSGKVILVPPKAGREEIRRSLFESLSSARQGEVSGKSYTPSYTSLAKLNWLYESQEKIDKTPDDIADHIINGFVLFAVEKAQEYDPLLKKR